MKVRIIILVIIVILLGLFQGGLLFVLFDEVEEVATSDLIYESYTMMPDYFEEAYNLAGNGFDFQGDKVYGGVVPHHLIVKGRIAAFFQGLPNKDYKTVVLIGPDHLDDSNFSVTSSIANWSTPYGILKPNIENINHLVEGDFVEIDETAMSIEHSISSLVSFIKNSLPQAKIVPIILSSNVTEEDASDLAQAIADEFGKNDTLVLASVDFSHLQVETSAEFHDKKSISTIKNFAFEDVYNLEIDSPPSIYTILKYMEIINKEQAILLSHTNTATLLNQPDWQSTTHNIFYFTDGEKENDQTINFLFGGDIMLDRGVKEVIDTKGFDYLLEDLAGEEGRFFSGIDLIGANLEGAITVEGKHYEPELTYDFAFEPDDVRALKKYNFNYFSLGNNHIYDQGRQGYEETEQFLQNENIAYAGCYDGLIADCSFTILNMGGKKIGLASFSEIYRDLNQTDLQKVLNQLNLDTDFMIVMLHWGEEYQSRQNKKQEQLAHLIIDAGADVVLGSHPHVVQGLEIYKNKPIFYSLGNYIFDQQFSSRTQENILVGLSLNSENIEVYLFLVQVNKYKSSLLLGEEKQDFLQRLWDLSDLDFPVLDIIKLNN